MKLFDNKYGLTFAMLGVILQVFAFWYTGASWLSLISGVSGIFAVVLCAERKISFYVFGWIQLLTYIILVYNQRLWGEVWENIFYGLTMFYGMYLWFMNRDEIDTSKVRPRRLKSRMLWLVYALGAIGVLSLWMILDKTNDSQPFMDSISTVPAIIAQLMMIYALKEQWYFWLIIDVASIVMWSIAGDWCMVSQFVFWTINCLYGLKKWK